jgi:tight adherence protein B
MRVSLLVLALLIFCFCIFLVVRQSMDATRIKKLARITGAPTDAREKEKKAQKITISQKLRNTGAGDPMKKGGLRDLIQQAGYQTSTKKYWMYSAITSFVTFLILLVCGTGKLALVLFTITGFLGLPKLYLKFKAKRRQKRFLNDFADALDAMVRLLKAGMPVTEAIAMVGREFEGPVGIEMAYIYDQQKIGVSLPQAAEKAALHVPITEMQMFATAVAIQAETGASLSEVLTNLSGVIRARFKLKRKIVALSSEARTSAMIIGALPIMVGSVLKLVNPDYMNNLFHDPTGHILLWGCGIWMSLGVLVMRQMINFRV